MKNSQNALRSAAVVLAGVLFSACAAHRVVKTDSSEDQSKKAAASAAQIVDSPTEDRYSKSLAQYVVCPLV